ncbi:MAG: tetratricopeptide repeat protein [Paludibacter sp.]|jgi:tetratricopeptide (TPR) repeat protein|nr:tetratricopeptide repeat protein [Paludibacter sp.]
MSVKQAIWLIGFICMCYPALAQEEYGPLRAGNKNYKAQKFTEAEIEYRKGLQKNKQSFDAVYNLGNALFRQKKYKEALELYQAAAPIEQESKLKRAAAFHNAGNALLLEKKVKESIEAYKQALRLNPSDDDTRYNLAFAQYLLKNQQEPPPQQQPQQQPQDQKQDQQQDQQQQPQQNDQMSKEQAEQILQALMQEEKETMEKAKKQPKATRKGTEKDW